MATKSSARPRIVVYLTDAQLKKAQKKATANKHKNHHRWGGAVIMDELNK